MAAKCNSYLTSIISINYPTFIIIFIIRTPSTSLLTVFLLPLLIILKFIINDNIKLIIYLSPPPPPLRTRLFSELFTEFFKSFYREYYYNKEINPVTLAASYALILLRRALKEPDAPKDIIVLKN